MDIDKELIEKLSDFISRKQLTWGTSGNFSFINSKGVIKISKSGANINELTIDDMVNIDGSDAGKRSKEYKFHQYVYEVSNAKYCVHLSPYYTTLFTMLDKKLKTNIFIEATYHLSNVAVVDYYNPGSEELALAIKKEAASANVILLKNHGCLLFDDNMKDLLELVEVLELVCKMNCQNQNLEEIGNIGVEYLAHSGKYKRVKELWDENRDNCR